MHTTTWLWGLMHTWFYWQQCFASPWWMFASRGLDETSTSEESSQRMGKLRENPELVLSELCKDRWSTWCLPKRKAPHLTNCNVSRYQQWFWVRALTAGRTAEMTGGSPSLQDAQATYGVLTLTARQKSKVILLFNLWRNLDWNSLSQKKSQI